MADDISPARDHPRSGTGVRTRRNSNIMDRTSGNIRGTLLRRCCMSFRTRTAVVAACVALVGTAWSSARAADQRAYTAGHELLQVNVQTVPTKQVDGGAMVG